jgi:ribosomal protein S6
MAVRTYEALFIFANSLKDEARDKALERIREEIGKLKGTVLGTEALGRRQFARPMKKLEGGFFVKLVISLDPRNVDPLLARFKLNEDIFRVQIVTTAEKAVETADSAGEEETHG